MKELPEQAYPPHPLAGLHNGRRAGQSPRETVRVARASATSRCERVVPLFPHLTPAPDHLRKHMAHASAHSPMPTTSVTTRWVGNNRRRRSRAPVRSMTSSTAASGSAAARASSSGRFPSPAGPVTASHDQPRNRTNSPPDGQLPPGKAIRSHLTYWYWA
jgi:hypothetical protein